jgi:hypothetical protein
MARRPLPLLLLSTLLFGCLGQREAAPPAAEGTPAAGAVGSGTDAAPAPAAAAYPAEGSAPAAAPAAAAPGSATVLASQETNWGGVTAEITEFRRKGNTLTARVRLRNGGPEQQTVEIKYPEVYLMDAANARKYEVLRDEKGSYIGALRSGYNERWYEYIEPAEQFTIWVKFPAPPPEVRAITLQLPGVPPFEDLAIQDG